MTIRRIVTSPFGSAPFEQLSGTQSNVPSIEIDDQTGQLYAGGEPIADVDPVPVPGGSTTDVQFNDAGAFGGIAGMTYDKVNAIVTIVSKLVLGALSNVDPNVNGRVWSNAGVVTVSAG